MTTVSGVCAQCGVFFTAFNRKESKNSFCNQKCYFAFKRLHRPEANCICEWCQEKFYRKQSAIKNGEGKFCSRKCKHTAQREGIIIRGESYNDRHLIRQSSAYKSWRAAAKKLKGNRCEKCGAEEGKKCDCCGYIIYLHVHHIKPFSTYPELRFDPSNASVLCPKCHHN